MYIMVAASFETLSKQTEIKISKYGLYF